MVEGTILLTSEEVGNITDYTDLRVGFSQDGAFGGSNVTEAEFQVPDAGGGGGGDVEDPTNPEAFLMFL